MSSETETVATAISDPRLKNLRPFKKGQSGNPAGRPKKVNDGLKAAENAFEKAMAKLAKLVDSEDDRVALQAAVAIADRVVGKPRQAVEVDAKHQHTHNGQEPISDTARWIEDTLRAGAEGQAPQPVPH